MFGGKTVKVKIDRDLYDRVRKIADVAGYATAEEFIAHVLEKEMLHFEDARIGRGHPQAPQGARLHLLNVGRARACSVRRRGARRVGAGRARARRGGADRAADRLRASPPSSPIRSRRSRRSSSRTPGRRTSTAPTHRPTA